MGPVSKKGMSWSQLLILDVCIYNLNAITNTRVHVINHAATVWYGTFFLNFPGPACIVYHQHKQWKYFQFHCLETDVGVSGMHSIIIMMLMSIILWL